MRRPRKPSSGATGNSLDLGSFKLQQATLEVRYPIALQLWDRAGAVWQFIQEKWPQIILTHAEPAKTVFRAGKSALLIELENARITTHAPEKSLDEFGKDARAFLTAVVQELKIPVFKRMGFRPVYFLECGSKEEAASIFLALGLLKLPERKLFEVSNSAINPQYLIRWESEAKGVFLQVRAETRKLDFDPPPELVDEIQPVHSEKDGITLDIDYYTVAPVEPAQVDAAEWIKHAVHLISRDTKYIFEG